MVLDVQRTVLPTTFDSSRQKTFQLIKELLLRFDFLRLLSDLRLRGCSPHLASREVHVTRVGAPSEIVNSA